MIDIIRHNRKAWDKESTDGSPWCTPVDDRIIERAKEGQWEVILTPNKSVPGAWFGDLKHQWVLCLASGGGQQAPVLAAAGAYVISLDNSLQQLTKDLTVARKHALPLHCLQADMSDLSMLKDEAFDLIFHPVANLFVADVHRVWRECYRVLKPGGVLLSGFMNPAYFLFDQDEARQSGGLDVKFTQPYSDLHSLDKKKLQALLDNHEALIFGHTLGDQIGGQIDAGFAITGFYEDHWSDEATPLNRFSSTSMATRALKPPASAGRFWRD